MNKNYSQYLSTKKTLYYNATNKLSHKIYQKSLTKYYIPKIYQKNIKSSLYNTIKPNYNNTQIYQKNQKLMKSIQQIDNINDEYQKVFGLEYFRNIVTAKVSEQSRENRIIRLARDRLKSSRTLNTIKKVDRKKNQLIDEFNKTFIDKQMGRVRLIIRKQREQEILEFERKNKMHYNMI